MVLRYFVTFGECQVGGWDVCITYSQFYCCTMWQVMQGDRVDQSMRMRLAEKKNKSDGSDVMLGSLPSWQDEVAR